MRPIRLDEIPFGGVTWLGSASNERNAFSVERPRRIRIAVNARGEIADRFRSNTIDSDEAVISAGRNESQLRPVRRPLLRMILPAHNELRWLTGPGTQRHEVNFP